MQHPIGNSRNGMTVYVNLIGSKAGSHIAQQPQLLGLVAEALRKTSLRGSEVSLEHDMQRAIGYDFVIGTSDQDTILYAQTHRDTVYTRFIKNGKPEPAQHLVLMLRLDTEGTYELLDTWIGRLNPPRPGSENETVESKTYWAKHAIVLDRQPIQPRTVTKICPY